MFWWLNTETFQIAENFNSISVHSRWISNFVWVVPFS